MIGIDLDGTLLDGRGRISRANLDAIRKAQQAGVMVVPCTGRAWVESRGLLEQLPGVELGVFVTGAVVGRIETGEALHVTRLEAGLAHDLVRSLEHLPDAVLVFRESEHCGHDYLVTGSGVLTSNTKWWLQVTGATVHYQSQVGLEQMGFSLRVGMVAASERIHEIVPGIRERFGDRILAHSFEAVTNRDGAEPTHVLEIFGAGVDKWRGLGWIARQEGIAPDQVAVIGDQVNDLGMFREAACAIAMDNAPDSVKAEADHVTGHCDDHGVSAAIENLLAGDWGR